MLREGEGLPASLVPHVIPLLAWDPVAEDAIRALKGVAEERVGQLIDALLDPEPAVRRPPPAGARVFGLRLAAGGRRRCCWASRTCGSRSGSTAGGRWRPSSSAARSCASTWSGCSTWCAASWRSGRPVWESQRLLDEVDGSRFVDGFLKQRAGQSLAHVFTLLSVVLPTVPLQIAYRGLHTDDQALRGTALEYLEGVLPRDIRDRLWPVLGDEPAAQRRHTTRPRADPGRAGQLQRVDHAQPAGAAASAGPPAHGGRGSESWLSTRSIRARREPTPTGAGVSDTKSFLPEELLSEQVQRLALFCLIAAALWTVGFVMDLLVLPYATGHAPELALADARVHERARSRSCVGFYAATSDATSQRKADVGIVDHAGQRRRRSPR